MAMAMAMPRHHHHRLHLRLPSLATSAPATPPSRLFPSFLSVRRASGIRRGAGGGSCLSGGVLVQVPFQRTTRECRTGFGSGVMAVRCSSSSWWEDWRAAPLSASSAAPCLSDVLWPSAGAFVAMALLGRMDRLIAPTGLSFTVAPLGAVCAVLFATPTTPGARVGWLGVPLLLHP